LDDKNPRESKSLVMRTTTAENREEGREAGEVLNEYKLIRDASTKRGGAYYLYVKSVIPRGVRVLDQSITGSQVDAAILACLRINIGRNQ